MQFERITYLRYQLVYLGKVYGGYRRSGTTDWWLPQQHIGDDTISHLCGDNRCIAPSHLIAEPLSDNQGREDCFLVIREWIDDHPELDLLYQKHTMMSCFGRLCPHGTHQCFISKGKH